MYRFQPSINPPPLSQDKKMTSCKNPPMAHESFCISYWTCGNFAPRSSLGLEAAYLQGTQSVRETWRRVVVTEGGVVVSFVTGPKLDQQKKGVTVLLGLLSYFLEMFFYKINCTFMILEENWKPWVFHGISTLLC